MLKSLLLFIFALRTTCGYCQIKITDWVTTTQSNLWLNQRSESAGHVVQDSTDVEILVDSALQIIEGFGASFNELG